MRCYSIKIFRRKDEKNWPAAHPVVVGVSINVSRKPSVHHRLKIGLVLLRRPVSSRVVPVDGDLRRCAPWVMPSDGHLQVTGVLRCLMIVRGVAEIDRIGWGISPDELVV